MKAICERKARIPHYGVIIFAMTKRVVLRELQLLRDFVEKVKTLYPTADQHQAYSLANEANNMRVDAIIKHVREHLPDD